EQGDAREADAGREQRLHGRRVQGVLNVGQQDVDVGVPGDGGGLRQRGAVADHEGKRVARREGSVEGDGLHRVHAVAAWTGGDRRNRSAGDTADGGNHGRHGQVASRAGEGDGDIAVQGNRAAPEVVVLLDHPGGVAEEAAAGAVEEEVVVPDLQAALHAAG